MGGLDPARDYVLRALHAGKHVVTANKQLLSQHGEELWEAARERGVQLRFEAAVAGVVPVIRVLQESLAAAHVDRLHGIVNGTTNFILTEMAAHRRDVRRGAGAGAGARLRRGRPDRGRQRQGRGREDGDPRSARLRHARSPRPGRLRGDRAHHRRTTSSTRASSASSLKLIGTAERVDGGLSRPRAPRLPLRRPPAGHRRRARSTRSRSSRRRSPRSRCRGPGAGGPQTASAVLGDVVSAMIPPALVPEPIVKLDIIEDVVSAFYVHLEVADRPGVLAQVAQILGMQGISVKSVVQKGMGEQARLVMVVHPTKESSFAAALQLIVAARLPALAAAGDPGDRGGVPLIPGVIERYRDRLPFASAGPGRHAPRGLDPARARPPHLRARRPRGAGSSSRAPIPTGSFKDRGMTCAVSAAVREGARAVICASTGNTAASAAAYAARAGLTGAVIVPEGKIATGKLAQALMHGARVVALSRDLRPRARARARAGRPPPDRAGELGQRVSAGGPEDRRPSRSSTRSERSTRCASRSGTPAT